MNPNFAHRDRFLLVVPEYENFALKVVSAPIPGVNTNPINLRGSTTDGTELKVDGDLISYEAAVWQFIVDDDLANYIELFDWLKENATSQSDIRADASLLIYDTTGEKVLRKVDLIDIAPIALSEVDFGTDSEIAQVLTCTVTMEYQEFQIMPPHDGLPVPGYIDPVVTEIDLFVSYAQHIMGVNQATGDIELSTVDGSEVSTDMVFDVSSRGYLTARLPENTKVINGEFKVVDGEIVLTPTV